MCVWAAVLVLGLVSLSGLVITTWWPFPMGQVQRLGAGILVGQLLYSIVAYAVAALMGMTAGHMVLALVLSCLPLAALPGRWRAIVAGEPQDFKPAALNLGALAVLLGVFFHGTVFERVPPHETTPAIYTNSDSCLFDLPVHMQFYGSFAWGGNYPPHDPEFADQHLAYPFLADFEAATLWPLGLDVTAAFPAQWFVLTFSLCCLLHGLTLAFTERLSAALAASWLALLNGGLGGLWLLIAPGPLYEHLRVDPTYGGPFWFGNLLTQYLINQRSFLFGFPIVVLVVTIWWQARPLPPRQRGAAMAVAGVLTACCPFAHSYSMVVLVGLAVLESLLFRDVRAWAIYLGVTGVLAAPQMPWFRGMNLGTFFAWEPGWMQTNGWVLLWIDNLGLFIPVLLFALWRTGNASKRLFYVPVAMLFVIANLFRISPQLMDNMKILNPWFVLSVPWVADFVTARRYGIVLGLALCLSGGMGVLGVVGGFRTTEVFTAPQVRQATAVRKAVPPQPVVLRSMVGRSAMQLAGVLCIYAVNVNLRGFPDDQRKADIQAIYEGRPEADALLQKYHVNYLWVSPIERGTYRVNDAWLSRWPKVLSQDGGDLYRIRMPPSPPSTNSLM
ncbi:MAG TPA: hypothetical protein VGO93_00480 [Candidatus Xenobia bacterium]